MKDKYSKLNEIAEGMLENENTCHGCPFRYYKYPEEYYSTTETCSHKYYKLIGAYFSPIKN